MIVFRTKRLEIKSIEEKDRKSFIELLTNPEIIDPLPNQNIDLEEVEQKFKLNLKLGEVPEKGVDNIWGVFEIGNSNMIGIGALLTNDDNEWELGYRLKVKSWNKEYGSELCKGLINYSLSKLHFEKITADVDVSNIASVKILEKYMNFAKEFYNKEDKCTDRRYEIRREEWNAKRN